MLTAFINLYKHLFIFMANKEKRTWICFQNKTYNIPIYAKFYT